MLEVSHRHLKFSSIHHLQQQQGEGEEKKTQEEHFILGGKDFKHQLL